MAVMRNPRCRPSTYMARRKFLSEAQKAVIDTYHSHGFNPTDIAKEISRHRTIVALYLRQKIMNLATHRKQNGKEVSEGMVGQIIRRAIIRKEIARKIQ